VRNKIILGIVEENKNTLPKNINIMPTIKLITNRRAWALVPSKLEPGNALA